MGYRAQDSFRSKLYDAENRCRYRRNVVDTIFGDDIFRTKRHGLRTFPEQRMFEDHAEVQAWVDEIAATEWFQRIWSEWNPGKELKPIIVKQLRADATTSFYQHGDPWSIYIANGGLSAWIVLHELGHLVLPNAFPGHGPEYGATLIEMVAHAFGHDVAWRLMNWMDRTGAAYAYQPYNDNVVRKRLRAFTRDKVKRTGIKNEGPHVTLVLKDGTAIRGHAMLVEESGGKIVELSKNVYVSATAKTNYRELFVSEIAYVVKT